MKRAYFVLSSIALSWLLCLGCHKDYMQPKAHAASVLMGQFESIFYANGEFLAKSGPFDSLSKVAALSLRYPFEYLDLAVQGSEKNFVPEMLHDSVGVFVGAKNFLPPQGAAGLGHVRSERCYVVLLRASGFDLKHYFKTEPAAILANGPVWQWAVHIDEFSSERIGDMPEGKPILTRLFATQIRHEYIVISNQFKDLQDISVKLSTDQNLDSLTQIHDWKTISQHEVWGYRKYRFNSIIEGDVTNAANKIASGMEDISPGIEALDCFWDERRGVLIAQLFLKPGMGEDNIMKINARNYFPPLTRSDKSSWRTSVVLSGDKKSDEAVLSVVGLFGFRIFS